MFRRTLSKTKPNMENLFSHGTIYAAHRPRYPKALTQALSDICTTHEVAWDVGTGTGQLASELSPHFDRVVATDINSSQLSSAPRDIPNVCFHHLSAEASAEELSKAGLDHGKVDLITVAQALHWFNFDEFHATVHKMLRPSGGVYAAITYALPNVNDEIDKLVREYHGEIVGPYWDSNRKWVDEFYKTVPLGCLTQHEITDKAVIHFPDEAKVMKSRWNLAMMLGYLDSWSSTQTKKKVTGQNPIWDDPQLIEGSKMLGEVMILSISKTLDMSYISELPKFN